MHGDDPLPVGLPDRLREGCCKLAGSLQTATEQLSRDLGQRWHSIASDSGHVLRTLAEAPGRAAQAHARHLQQQPLSPAFASLSLGSLATASRRRRAQPVADLAYNPEDIKARLSAVNVYTVANKKNEFVLVSGEGDSEERQLGLFFFKEADAKALIDKIREQNPRLAKQSSVLSVSMDAVYSFATSPRESSNASGVVFRFMPDALQVEAALNLYRDAGVDVLGFTGVPVFQAEGLTVKTEKARYTPLFLSKADLDLAVSNAYQQRVGAETEATRAKADRAAAELADAEQEVAEAKDRKARKAAQQTVSQAKGRLGKYEERLKELAATPGVPKVEVGSLEEVIVKMEHDTKGEWGDVMFVPPNALASARS